jgi:hypothetical protein
MFAPMHTTSILRKRIRNRKILKFKEDFLIPMKLQLCSRITIEFLPLNGQVWKYKTKNGRR